MSDAELQRGFPNLRHSGYEITSPEDRGYNCIAWAAGVTDAWWWPDPWEIGYWPNGVPREETIQAFIQAFGTRGYTPCEDDSLEAAFEKIALYANAGVPTHAARQLEDGRWSSKCGDLEDIAHTLDGLAGTSYGQRVVTLARPL